MCATFSPPHLFTLPIILLRKAGEEIDRPRGLEGVQLLPYCCSIKTPNGSYVKWFYEGETGPCSGK